VGEDKITIVIKSPTDREQVNSRSFTVSAEATSVTDISKIEIYIDGEKKRESNSKSVSDTFSVSTDGNHTIQIKAVDRDGNATERQIAIGVNQPYGTPTPLPTATPMNTPSPTVSP
jgi:hypothetical protein